MTAPFRILACASVLFLSITLHAVEYHVKPDGSADFVKIQAAIAASGDGDTVVVHPGIYLENIHFDGKSVVLTSLDPSSDAIVESTVIDGGVIATAISLSGQETESCALRGFKITAGRGKYGGGIYGGSGPFSLCSIERCRIEGNFAEYGGGISRLDGEVTGCTIRNNQVEENGGGLYRCGGHIVNCEITDNSAGGCGGGLYNCDATIEMCVVAGNTAANLGGGLFDCDGLVQGCQVIGNLARSNDGGGFYSCDGDIRDCRIVRNASSHGGGIAFCTANIANCAVVGNSADYSGGGLYRCSGPISRSIIIDNAAIAGGGLKECDWKISGCIISGNFADDSGGGAYECGGDIQGCRISSNFALTGFGGGLCSCDGPTLNCLINENTAKRSGGGLYGCDGALDCCTIADNRVTEEGGSYGGGGGLASCEDEITNCIFWGNEAEYDNNLSEYYTPSHCCIENWRGAGAANISYNPQFVHGQFGAYYLSSRAAGQNVNSPCIDGGSGTADDYGLYDLTTTTDNTLDDEEIDIGYHYPRVRVGLWTSLNKDHFSHGDTIRGYLAFENDEAGIPVDAFLALITPEGQTLSLGPHGFAYGMQFWFTNVTLPVGFGFDEELVFELVVPESATPGLYLYLVEIKPAFTPSLILTSTTLFTIEPNGDMQ